MERSAGAERGVRGGLAVRNRPQILQLQEASESGNSYSRIFIFAAAHRGTLIQGGRFRWDGVLPRPAAGRSSDMRISKSDLNQTCRAQANAVEPHVCV